MILVPNMMYTLKDKTKTLTLTQGHKSGTLRQPQMITHIDTVRELNFDFGRRDTTVMRQRNMQNILILTKGQGHMDCVCLNRIILIILKTTKANCIKLGR